MSVEIVYNENSKTFQEVISQLFILQIKNTAAQTGKGTKRNE
ncbi:MAG: hypothetical protein Q4G33_01895 [bacterium]|nr:hypothetical protein [bacterium]